MNKNVVWHKNKLNPELREKLKHHKGACLWFTGLSGSGKSTLAVEVEWELHKRGVHTFILDGDNIRHGLNKDLEFSPQDRKENIRRIGEVAKLFVDAGIIVLTAFISPYKEDRKVVRDLLEENQFIEIYVECDIDTCEKRDPKGLYKLARENKIKDFTGISAPYEKPESPEIILNNNDDVNVKINVERVISFLIDKNIIKD